MKSAFLSRFTPSLLPPEALEHMFVQRSRLAGTIVAGLRESGLTSGKHYYLVTGPRGIGKTHLVSLVYHRLRRDKDLRAKLRIAWLREEEWGVASYLDLLLVILRTVHEQGDAPELSEKYARLKQITNPEEACAVAERLVVEAAGAGTLLIIAENLDEIFRGLETAGQRRLRALIQNHPVFAILATSQSLFDGITNRDEPFYGFFDVHQLDELSFENAVRLVARIAEHEGNQALARAVSSPLGRARLRAVHHLAAGNPRVYVIFSQFLTVNSLDALVGPLLETLDDLTPYYQARMSHLSPQQRKIVEYLCAKRGGETVSGIARANFISPQTTSSQLRKLDEFGYVRSVQYGRISYYELREPLLRLTLEVKKLRGEPVRLIVEFLRVWYSEQELTDRMTVAQTSWERDYITAALDLKHQEGEDLLVQTCRSEMERLLAAEETARALDVADELIAVGGGIEDCDRIIEMPEASDEQVARALGRKGMLLVTQRRLADAIEVFDEVVRRFADRDEPVLAEGVARALANKGVALGSLGRFEDAIEVYDEVVRRFADREEPNLAEEVARALVNKGVTLGSLGRPEEETKVYDEVVRRFADRKEPSLAEQVARALVNKGVTLGSLGRSEDAIEVYDEVVRRFGNRDQPNLAEGVARALFSKAILHAVMGRFEEGRKALQSAQERPASKDGDWVPGGVDFLNHLLRRTRDEAEWRRVVAFLIEAYDQRGHLATLGVGLVRSCRALADGSIDKESASRWLDVWTELGGSREQMRIPLRMLKAAVAYLKQGKSEELQALPAEERSLLKSALHVDTDDRRGSIR
ncbi:MAG: tetratricopeptide repeat protein [Phycisphaeraceae bacterium]|nr:tetratricopeptide repeat protein [Phycisphaeraceae bacterium]